MWDISILITDFYQWPLNQVASDYVNIQFQDYYFIAQVVQLTVVNITQFKSGPAEVLFEICSQCLVAQYTEAFRIPHLEVISSERSPIAQTGRKPYCFVWRLKPPIIMCVTKKKKSFSSPSCPLILTQWFCLCMLAEKWVTDDYLAFWMWGTQTS